MGTELWQHIRRLDSKIVVLLLFASILGLGSFIYKDYGMSADERASRVRGGMTMLYVNYKLGRPLYSKKKVAIKLKSINEKSKIPVTETSILTHVSRGHGTFFDILLVGAEVVTGVKEVYQVYQLRHWVTFAYFWVGLIFFYLLLNHLGFHWKWSLLGTLFLLLSPRIFANSFYNMKDLAFLSAYVMAAYTSFRFLKEQDVKWAVFHAVTTAISIDIRIPGVVIPIITGSAFFIYGITSNKTIAFTWIRNLMIYYIVLSIFVILFWPFLWEDPLGNFIYAFSKLGAFPAEVNMYFWGKTILSTELPWYYLPSWMFITTPLLLIVLFVIGLFYTLGILVNRKVLWDQKLPMIKTLIFLFLPLIAIIFKSSVLYNGWRHVYFVYPFFIILSLCGLKYIESNLSRYTHRAIKVMRFGIGLILLYLVGNIVYYHPYEHSYFNIFAGKDIKNRFDTDYWGLCYKSGYDYILEHFDKEKLNVYVPLTAEALKADILRPKDKKRLNFVSFEQADLLLFARGGYFSESFVKKNNLNGYKEIHQVYAGDVHIFSVFQKDNSER